MRILFLYTELADYTISCLKQLKIDNPEVEIAVIHYPVNPEAPFLFDFKEIGNFRDINDFKSFAEIKRFAENFHPSKIVVSGWSNKWYFRLCLFGRRQSTCILTMDNHWTASLRQKVLLLFSRFIFPAIFKKIWIPGKPQVQYALNLGFKKEQIIEGFYSCDTGFYIKLGAEANEIKSQHFPKRLICVARYIPAKNYNLLWKAFIEWKEHTNNEWELWCAGTGADFEDRVKHPSIQHLGFIQKNEWKEIIQQTGVFVLPSLSEPWGVVVHEFAASGYPLILSNKIGAASSFLTDKNGWLFDPGSKNELIEAFTKLDKASAAALLEMGRKSSEAAKKITPALWSASLVEI
ncbi:MAG: glycosyltransferase [Agriterribacter sp.]